MLVKVNTTRVRVKNFTRFTARLYVFVGNTLFYSYFYLNHLDVQVTQSKNLQI